jgi:hypothetical protein
MKKENNIMRLRETKEEGTKNMHSISQRELLC